jgi:hypothetical protein
MDKSGPFPTTDHSSIGQILHVLRWSSIDYSGFETERRRVKTADLCRQHGINTATFYAWRSKYGAWR